MNRYFMEKYEITKHLINFSLKNFTIKSQYYHAHETDHSQFLFRFTILKFLKEFFI